MDRDCDARVLLGLLLDEPSRHFADTELASLTGWPRWRVKDAQAALVADGLAHRQRRFSFSSRAARRADQLIG